MIDGGQGGDQAAVYRLREMRREDVPRIMAVELASFTLPWTPSMFLAELEDPMSWAKVAVNAEGEVIGYLLARYYGDLWHLINIAVRFGDRRKGIAGSMLDDFLSNISLTSASVTLEVRPSNEAAIRLYESKGFEAVGRRRGYYRDNDEDALLMLRKGRPGGEAGK